MSSTATLQFQVIPNLPLEDYQKLWDQAMFKVSFLLVELKRPRSISNIESYIDELYNFELLTTQEDLNGRIWQETNPDIAFRNAAEKVYSFFKGIRAEAKSSPDIAFNVDLYLAEKVDNDTAADSRRLVQRWQKDLRRGGAYLDPSAGEKVAALTKAIDKEETRFLTNVRQDDRHLKLDIEELKGVPADYFAAHPLQPDGKVHVFSKLIDIMAIMDHCQVRSTREKVYRMQENQGHPANEPVLLRLLALRREKANILGYANWAEYQMENMTLKTPDAVNDFLDEAFQSLKPQSGWEKQQIDKSLWEREGIVTEPWDIRYGMYLMKEDLLPGYDPIKAREYFPADKVIPALQSMVAKIFDLRFVPQPINAWHPSVTMCNVYDVSKGDKLLGRIFFDLFSRDGKIDYVAEYSMRPPVSGKQLAEIVLFANTSSDDNACLNLEECRNLLHALGHCVHCLVGDQRYAKFAGIGEPARQKDFTEAPGMMLEQLLGDKALFGFAINREGERIPETLLDQLLTSDMLERGINDRTWLLVNAKCSLDLHTSSVTSTSDVTSIMKDAYAMYSSLPMSSGISPQNGFFFLAFPDYGSLYYCYLFSQALSRDLFTEIFQSRDQTANGGVQRYRERVLEKGSSRDAGEMISEFLGRGSNLKAYSRWVPEGRRWMEKTAKPE